MVPAVLLLVAGAGAIWALTRRTETATTTPEDTGNADPLILAPESIPSGPGWVSGFDLPAGDQGATVSSWKLPAAAAPYAETIARAESDNGLPAGLLGRLLQQESGFRQDIIDGRTRSSAGAIGIAQFTPDTAKGAGVDPLDPVSAINGAGRYLRQLFDQFGSWPQALAAYNWGPGNVKRKGIAKAPPETRAYVARITSDVPV